MFTFLQARREAWRLTRRLRKSLIGQDGVWEIDADRMGRPVLGTGHARIVVAPRPWRLFDAIHVYCDEAEIWLPLVPRLRLRSAVRFYLLRFANEQAMSPCVPTEVRFRAAQEQPV